MRKSGKPASSKGDELAHTLWQRIVSGKLPVGAHLPTTRQLSDEWNVSVATASRAVQRLARQGLVRCYAARTGTVVIRSQPLPEQRPNTLACLLRHWRPRNSVDNFLLDMIESIQNQISLRGYRFLHHSLREEDFESRIMALIDEPWVAGILLDQVVEDELVAKVIRQTSRPVVVLRRTDVDSTRLTCVFPDLVQIGRETFRFLRQRGYERFVIWSGPPVRSDIQTGLREAASLAGMSDRVVTLSDPPNHHWQVYPLDFLGLPLKAGPDWKPLAFVAASDTRAMRVLGSLRQTSMVIGRDVGVVGSAGLPGLPKDLAPTTWKIDPVQFGTVAINTLVDRIEQPDLLISRVHIQTQFVNRGSA